MLPIMGRVTIEGRFPSLNDYIKALQQHRLRGAAMKSDETERVRLHFLSHPKLDIPVYISLTWYEPNTRRDPDNIVFAKKFIFDGLVKAGVIPDDSQKWIVGFEDMVNVDKENPRVEISVIGVTNASPKQTN